MLQKLVHKGKENGPAAASLPVLALSQISVANSGLFPARRFPTNESL